MCSSLRQLVCRGKKFCTAQIEKLFVVKNENIQDISADSKGNYKA
jgi:hypothetical protein